MKHLLIELLLVVSFYTMVSINANAQNYRIYFEAETSLSYSITQYKDSGSRFNIRNNIPNPVSGGINAGMIYKRKAWTELGISYHQQRIKRYCLGSPNSCLTVNMKGSVDIVNRYGWQIPLIRNRILVSPSLGYRINLSTLQSSWSKFENDSSFALSPASSVPYINGERNDRLVNAIHLLEGSLKISYLTSENGCFSIFVRYAQGFQKVAVTQFDYLFGDGRSGNAKYWQNGSYWMFGASVSYVFPTKTKA